MSWPVGSRRQLELPLRGGGYGYGNMEWLAPASHVSGWADTAAAVPRLAPSLTDEVLAGLHYVEKGKGHLYRSL